MMSTAESSSYMSGMSDAAPASPLSQAPIPSSVLDNSDHLDMMEDHESDNCDYPNEGHRYVIRHHHQFIPIASQETISITSAEKEIDKKQNATHTKDSSKTSIHSQEQQLAEQTIFQSMSAPEMSITTKASNKPNLTTSLSPLLIGKITNNCDNMNNSNNRDEQRQSSSTRSDSLGLFHPRHLLTQIRMLLK
jgi:hypothetical protein